MRTDGQTDTQTDRRANITKPIDPFQNYANVSENAQRFRWLDSFPSSDRIRNGENNCGELARKS
jgi:hypothetical protein